MKQLTSIIRFPLREAYIAWRFIRYDVTATIMPGLTFMLVSWLYSKEPWERLPFYIICSFCFMLLYVYTFCMSNQINSVEEDRLNKPDRPLPAGLITVEATYLRMTVYNLFFVALAHALHLFWYAIAWQLVTMLLNQAHWSQHWISKNLLAMSMGCAILISSQWQIVQPLSFGIAAFICIISLWIGIGASIQDIRDQEGDRKVGRRTLPIDIGDGKARAVLGVHFLIISPLLVFLLILSQAGSHRIMINPVIVVVFIMSVGISWWIAYRLWTYRAKMADRISYQIFLCMFSYLLISPCFLR